MTAAFANDRATFRDTCGDWRSSHAIAHLVEGVGEGIERGGGEMKPFPRKTEFVVGGAFVRSFTAYASRARTSPSKAITTNYISRSNVVESCVGSLSVEKKGDDEL